MKRRFLEALGGTRTSSVSVRLLLGSGVVLLGILATSGQARRPVPIPMVGDVGACCLEELTICYENFTEPACLIFGGEWIGAGTSCDDCPFMATGACCFSQGECFDVTSEYCELSGGTWLGAGTVCDFDDFECGAPLGACCLEDSCVDETEAKCATLGGTWLGADTECEFSTEGCASLPIYVPEDFPSIQQAINHAVDGTEISVASGVYGGEGDSVINLAGKQVWLHSREGADFTFITGEDVRRVFESIEDVGNEALIEGFTFLSGVSAEDGGGLFIANGGEPVFRDCVIRNHRAMNGAGCAIVGSSPRFENCDFIDNIAVSFGGAILVEGGANPRFSGCRVTGNVAAYEAGHAAINVQEGAGAFIEDTTICDNLPYQIFGVWVDGGGNDICQCPADVTGDGLVDGYDLTQLLSAWGPCPDECPFDFDDSGTVDGSDLLVILSGWGPCPG